MADFTNRLKPVKTRSYLNKDFEGFRADLLRYARTFFPDRIKDFSENSLGGLFLEMAAYVGDVNSFYLDHQFGELSPETAVETKNIERHIRSAGVEITGASPASVTIDMYISVPAELSGTTYQPQASALPIILQGTVFKSRSGITFELTEDVDFSEVDDDGNMKASIQVEATSSTGIPLSYILKLSGLAISGTTATQTFSIPNVFLPFRTITLSKENITEIISVTDSEGNNYYQVDSLTQDSVFKGILNISTDQTLVKENLEVIPAPYRYTKKTSLQTGLTTLQFGGGNADSTDDDIVPDPSELSLPLYGKKTFSRFSLDPNKLLQTKTLGISPINTTLTVKYRYGGGLAHNVSADTIRSVSKLDLKFAGIPTPSVAAAVRASLDVRNPAAARGGDNALTIDELKAKIPAARNSQSRIVTREDLLARIYTMPSNFGRVFRAGIRSNPDNPLASQLFIISRDNKQSLAISPDTLKLNLRTYLDQFRLISDAIDILDAQIVNIGIQFQIATTPESNRSGVVQSIMSELKLYFDIKNFQIDQPISQSDILNIMINTPGVVSVIDYKIFNNRGTILERVYSEVGYDIEGNTVKGLVIPPPGGIFEIKYPDYDIIGSAV